MLDISIIRTEPELVKKACRDKNLDEALVDSVLVLDEKRRKLQGRMDELRSQANQVAETIKQQVQAKNKPDQSLVERGKSIKNELKQQEPEYAQVADELEQKLLHLPNVAASDVPVGKDESGNQMVRQVGDLPEYSFTPRPHDELMKALDLLDTDNAVRIGGFRSYFLRNEAVLLEQALLWYAQKLMVEAGFTPMTAPVLVNHEALVGTGYFPWGQDDHYVTQDGQGLAGTAEVALTAYYGGQTLTEANLPIKMVGISPCFRREVGSHGKDTAGIVRVHQFNKVEQVVYTVADETETRSWHEKMLGYSEQLLQDLGLPYQVLLMCTGDMGAGQRKKYDIETWFPAQQKYRETHSASYFLDFQARRLNIRYRAKDGQLKYVYTLNNTVAASPRLLAALIENYQQADGNIRVPRVLQSFVGFESIKPRS